MLPDTRQGGGGGMGAPWDGVRPPQPLGSRGREEEEEEEELDLS